MLACARRRVQSVLPRPFAFSTVPKPDVPWENPMTELTNLLDNTADRISPIIPAGYGGTSPSGQRSNTFRTNRIVNPADLTRQTCTYQHRRPKKAYIAPPSSICRHNDPFYQLNLDPRDFTANPVVLSEYLSEMGKIHGRTQTYLTAKNQRLLSKTIRRAKMMGIIPHLSVLTWVEKSGRLRRR